MIVETNYLTIWKATRSITRLQLPKLVDRIARVGGRFLLFQNTLIHLQDAVHHKRKASLLAFEASMHARLCERTVSKIEKIRTRRKMEQAAKTAGSCFCRYLYELNLLDGVCTPAIPSMISTHPELMKFWNEGFQLTEIGFTTKLVGRDEICRLKEDAVRTRYRSSGPFERSM